MAYVGNLTCNDCGLTFTSRWGSFEHADEYRCRLDHVVFADPGTGAILGVESEPGTEVTLADLRGRCPICSEELATGMLPGCPVCGGRDHEVALAGLLS